jgi:N-acetylglucosaminylphosphatidylinositol deacetylase
LKGSCENLGINLDRCIAIDHPELQDNPREWWNEALIERIVGEYVQKWNVDAVSLPTHESFSHYHFS